MNLFRDIERLVDERMRKLFGSAEAAGTSRGRELIEIQKAIFDGIDERVQQLPRARRLFPYNDVVIRVPLPDPERRIAFETVFIADGALREGIVEHLRNEQVEFPPDLKVEVTLVETTELTEPSFVCRTTEKAAPAPVGIKAVRLTPENGTSVEINRTRIQVGRQADVLDERKRLVRRNDLTLEHNTVSRAHAHMEFASGEYRLFDDGSSYGTSLIHEGRLIEVPRGGARGIRLHSGDKIYFGQVRVRFELVI